MNNPLERRDLRRWDGARYQPVLFSRSSCAGCALVRDHLAAHGLSPIDLDIEEDDRALRLLLTLAGRAWVPTVVFRHEIAIGCDIGRLEDLLNTPYEPLEDYGEDDEPEPAETPVIEEADEDDGVIEPPSEIVLALEVEAR